MGFSRLNRLPKRISDDVRIVGLTKNFRQVLWAKLKQATLTQLRFRNGMVIDSPNEVSLNFLFHEIWINEFYAPIGYEIRAGETIVDIGANIGVFAFWAATRARDVKVISFEPFPANAEYFRENLERSGLSNIEFHEAAVAGRNETRTLKVSESWILHSLADPNSESEGIEVKCVTLDDALAKLEKCDFLKLDCEGGEYEILYSALPDTLAKVGRLVCEFNVLDDNERNGDGLMRFLLSCGFKVDDVRLLDPASGYICAMRL